MTMMKTMVLIGHHAYTVFGTSMMHGQLKVVSLQAIELPLFVKQLLTGVMVQVAAVVTV